MNEHKLFTSESVGEGHPDKLCDQISDAVLDACLRDDPGSHVACETFASTALILIGGEITTNTFVDIQQTARNIARDIGYTDSAFGLDCNSMAVLSMIHAQSPDIAQGVNGTGLSEYQNQMGAGDQGMMFGYACKETPELMPAPIMYAHKLLRKASQLRKSKKIDWLRPDAKSQVTVEYEGDKPVRIDTVVISHQHDPEISYASLKEAIIEKIDIGGISLIRAGAKNHKDVVIVSSKADYQPLLDIVKTQGAETTLEQRKQFATNAFATSSHYDTAIHEWFSKQ